MDKAFLRKLADEVSEFESLQNNWPADWEYEQVDERIEKHETILEAAEKRGLNRLDAGDFRVVFDVLPKNDVGLAADTVLKVSKYDGTRQNADSIEIYSSLDEGARTYVADIINSGQDNRWLLQEKAQSARTGDVKVVADGLSQYGYQCSDIRRENCGRIGEQAVLVDLALLR